MNALAKSDIEASNSREVLVAIDASESLDFFFFFVQLCVQTDRLSLRSRNVILYIVWWNFFLCYSSLMQLLF